MKDLVWSLYYPGRPPPLLSAMKPMDVIVTVVPDGKSWMLTDLLGRDMGCITHTASRVFTIHPSGHAVETMAAIISTGYASVDEALAAIELQTRGVCRRAR